MSTIASRVEPYPSWSVTERMTWLFTQLIMAFLWLGFFWFGAKILRDSPMDEVVDSLMWLAKATWFYLAALGIWVGFNILLYKYRGPSKPKAHATTVFTQDYFGRGIQVDPSATLSDSHLIVELKEGNKVYGLEVPEPQPEPAVPILVGSSQSREVVGV